MAIDPQNPEAYSWNPQGEEAIAWARRVEKDAERVLSGRMSINDWRARYAETSRGRD